MTNEEQQLVIQRMNGTWKFENEDKSWIVTISPLQITVDLNAQQEVFNNNGFWMDNHHLGFGNQYFVFNASEDSLIFGRHALPIMVGNYEWIETFNRVGD